MSASRSKVERATTRKSVTLPDGLWQEIAAYRDGQMLGTEAEAIRRLILVGLSADPPIKPRKPKTA